VKAGIEVERTRSADGGFEFRVAVREAKSATHHRVTLKGTTYDALTGGTATPEDLVRAAFAFLLEREPKESILAEFDVTVISRYFPEFQKRIRTYL
jgi:hypothetical protein